MKILILGASGMLGHAIFRYFAGKAGYVVYGTLRTNTALRYFPEDLQPNMMLNVDALNVDSLQDIFSRIRPDVVVNCIGLIKQLSDANTPLAALPLNAMLPHRLDKLCGLVNARLVHFSTDCVFSGLKGMYEESDKPDAADLYGMSKYIGEVRDSRSAITLRTSIIGHELGSSHALVDWFLSQSGAIKGYRKAIFSGLPTIEVARVLGQYVFPNSDLHGLYHLSVEPIDKMSLLQHVADIYGKNIEIQPDDTVCIDRSLNSSRFRHATGYTPPGWADLVRNMYESYLKFINSK